MNNENSISTIENLLKSKNKNFIENDLIPFLKIPSNTLNEVGINEAKKFLISKISSFSEEIIEYSGEINPLILSKVQGEIKENLLVYMMYDTQPINNQNDWISDPFGAEIRILPPPLNNLGKCIVARGAYNSKTALLSFLNVVKLLKEKEVLPISLLLLFDGEEEKGSPTLLKLLESKNQKKIFANCIDAYYPSIKQDLSGKLVLKLGYKGILSLTIKVSSQNKQTHSAFSGMIPNPSVDLISLLNRIYSNNGFHIDSLKKSYELSEEEKSIMNDLTMNLDLNKIIKKAGIIQTVEKDPNLDFFNYLFNPTFNISTLKSGFLEKGIKNYVPNQAICNIDIRFAHNVSVDEIFKEIKEKVEIYAKKSKSKIELTKNVGYEGSRINKNSNLVASGIKSSKLLGVSTEIWPLSAAAAPLSQIKDSLDLNFISGGLGIGGFAHSPNEFIQLDSIINTQLFYYYFLKNYSELYKKKNF
ncbi:MAG: M20/M25/M40 family metallo-hydrolase [Promethearchaeota archaeon]